MKLTPAQIQDYNSLNAFAGNRTEARGFAPAAGTTSAYKRIRTSDVAESQRILSGASERVGRMESNLLSMLELAREGAHSRATPERKAEIFGLLRSLSAGMDIIVEETKFKGEKVLDGVAFRLAGGGAASNLTVRDLSASGTTALNISEKAEGANLKVWYDDLSVWRNQGVGLVGLDITGAKASEASKSTRELENGIYEIEVIYGGPESSVVLRDSTGVERGRADQVDLSGTGTETVRFDLGVELEIDKKQITESVDKYDYEAFGKPSLFAKLNYQRIYTHNLAGADALTPRSTAWVNLPPPAQDASGNTLNFSRTGLGAVSEGKTELAEGQYKVELSYRGANSSAYLYDASGRLMMGLNIDLSSAGRKTIDFGNGLNVSIENDGFTGSSASLSALVEYRREKQSFETFDFGEYARKLEGAHGVLAGQVKALQAAQQQVELTRGAAMPGTQGGYSFAGLAGQSQTSQLLAQMLSGPSGGGISSLFNSSDVAAQLQWSSAMILNPLLNSTGAQANQSAGSLLTLFSGITGAGPGAR